jgi:hypothetical protein
MNTQFKSESLKGRDHMDDLGMDGRILLSIPKYCVQLRTGLIWMKIGTSDGLL